MSRYLFVGGVVDGQFITVLDDMPVLTTAEPAPIVGHGAVTNEEARAMNLRHDTYVREELREDYKTWYVYRWVGLKHLSIMDILINGYRRK